MNDHWYESIFGVFAGFALVLFAIAAGMALMVWAIGAVQ